MLRRWSVLAVIAASLVFTSLAHAQEPATWEVDLEVGWNLFSVPLDAEDLNFAAFVSAADQAGVMVPFVGAYERGRWELYIDGYPFNGNRPIQAGVGYIAYAMTPGVVSIDGLSPFSCPPTFTPTNTLTFTPTFTPTPTSTPTPTNTPTPSNTPTDTPTATPTDTPTNTPTSTPTPTPIVAGVPFSTDPIIGTLSYIAGGTFDQGSSDTEGCRDTDETQFTHTLSRDFLMMRTEVTRGMWDALQQAAPALGDDPSDEQRSTGMQNPVSNVSWQRAVLFANLLSIENGFTPVYYRDSVFSDVLDEFSDFTSSASDVLANLDADGYRLPTEGEWEYAARAGTGTPFSFDEALYRAQGCTDCNAGTFPTAEEHALFCSNDIGRTEAVAQKLPNAWMLFDMHGNVYEHCWDGYNTYPQAPETDYLGFDASNNRVYRGGGYTNHLADLRSADRVSQNWTGQRNDLGFRLVRTLPSLSSGQIPSPTPTPSPTAIAKPGDELSFDAGLGSMVFVPSGTLLQGSPATEACRDTDENQFSNTLPRNFLMMATEFTQQMYADLQANNPILPDLLDPTDFRDFGLDLPLDNVSWEDAILIANELSIVNGLRAAYYTDAAFTAVYDDVTGALQPNQIFWDKSANGYRLPTEGEWEWAARAGTTTMFPYAIDEVSFASLCANCNTGVFPVLEQYEILCGNDRGRMEQPGILLPNPWGLFDTLGNLREWTWDGYATYPTSPTFDFTGVDALSNRVVKGGQFTNQPGDARPAERQSVSGNNRVDGIGFRLVRNYDVTVSFPTPTPTPTPTMAPVTGSIFESNAIIGDLLYIEAGTFTQGSPGDEPGRAADETPFVHTLTQSFAMMETEITRQMWADLKSAAGVALPDDPSDDRATLSDLLTEPVQNVTFQEAIVFANVLSVEAGLTPVYYVDEAFTTPWDIGDVGSTSTTLLWDRTANGYRLPSEGEWEFAARGGTATTFPFAEPFYRNFLSSCTVDSLPTLDQYAVYCANDVNGIEPAATKLPNPWGLYDMFGNVAELVFDFANIYPIAAVDYVGRATGGNRVYRGGSYSDQPLNIRPARRRNVNPRSRLTTIGFRLVRNAD